MDDKEIDELIQTVKAGNLPPISRTAGLHDYYRSHMDEFVEEYLGVKLRPFQKLLLKILAKIN